MWLPAVSFMLVIPQDMKEQPISEIGEGYMDATGVARGHNDVIASTNNDIGGHNDVIASTSNNIEGRNDVIPSTSIDTGNHKDNIITSTSVQQSQSVSELDSILRDVETCLSSAGMMENITAAKKNAEYFLSVLRHIIPRNFDNTYRSPCWQMDFHAAWFSFRMGDVTSSHRGLPYEVEADLVKLYHGHFSSSIVCFPKVFIAGYPKCGSTFLYCFLNRIIHHSLGVPISQSAKEPHWWVKAGYHPKPHKPVASDIGGYLLNFARGLDTIQRSHYNAVTIDGSPNIMWSWPQFYPSEGLVNYCLLPSVIPQVLPTSKFIVVMRNPLDMLYSAFWFSCTTMYGLRLSMATMLKGPDIFHERIVTKIQLFNSCTQRHSLDKCVFDITFNIYNGTTGFSTCGRSRLEMGLYYIHVRKWLSVVPRKRFLFLTLEELSKDLSTIARKITDFLDIPPPKTVNITDYVHSCSPSLNTQQSVDYRHDHRLQMRNDTREFLESFFRPFNQRLAELVGDSKFLWER